LNIPFRGGILNKEQRLRPLFSVTHLLQRIFPTLGYFNFYDENLDAHWNYTSFKGKNILDLGADYGSTVSYFLHKKAFFVTAVEGNHVFFIELKNRYEAYPEVTCKEVMIDSAKKMEELIHSGWFDFAKVDVEGAEKYLLQTPTIIFIPEWLIETHSKEVDSALIKHFQIHCFNVYRVSEHLLKMVMKKRLN